jgi:hypothetical protein
MRSSSERAARRSAGSALESEEARGAAGSRADGPPWKDPPATDRVIGRRIEPRRAGVGVTSERGNDGPGAGGGMGPGPGDGIGGGSGDGTGEGSGDGTGGGSGDGIGGGSGDGTGGGSGVGGGSEGRPGGAGSGGEGSRSPNAVSTAPRMRPRLSGLRRRSPPARAAGPMTSWMGGSLSAAPRRGCSLGHLAETVPHCRTDRPGTFGPLWHAASAGCPIGASRPGQMVWMRFRAFESLPPPTPSRWMLPTAYRDGSRGPWPGRPSPPWSDC